jgi:hypothetical protein
MRKFSSGNEGGDSKRKKADQEKERTGKNEIFVATQMVVFFKLIKKLKGGLK